MNEPRQMSESNSTMTKEKKNARKKVSLEMDFLNWYVIGRSGVRVSEFRLQTDVVATATRKALKNVTANDFLQDSQVNLPPPVSLKLFIYKRSTMLCVPMEGSINENLMAEQKAREGEKLFPPR